MEKRHAGTYIYIQITYNCFISTIYVPLLIDLIKAYHALKQKETLLNSIIKSNTPIAGVDDTEGLAAYLKNMQLKNQVGPHCTRLYQSIIHGI